MVAQKQWRIVGGGGFEEEFTLDRIEFVWNPPPKFESDYATAQKTVEENKKLSKKNKNGIKSGCDRILYGKSFV